MRARAFPRLVASSCACALLALALALRPSPAVAALVGGFADSWRWVRFTTESGLPPGAVSAVVETSAGEPWIATASGLAWYDGWRWHAIAAPNAPGAPASLASLDGSTWGSADPGVTWVQDGRVFRSVDHAAVEVHVELDGGACVVSSAAPVDDAVVGRGILVVARRGTDPAEAGILLLATPAGCRTLPPPAGSTRPLRVRASRTGPWLETDTGLFGVGVAGFELVLPSTRCCRQLGHVVTSAGGETLAAVNFPPEQRGTWEWGPGRAPTRNPAAGSLVLGGLDVDAVGDVLAVFQTGDAWTRRSGAWERVVPRPEQLADVTCIRIRSNGDPWIGTSDGLWLFRGSCARWTTWRDPLPTTRNRVHDFARHADGTLWIATAAGIEARRPDGRVEWFTVAGDTPLLDVTGVAVDRDGGLWAVSGNSFTGAWRWDGRQWRHFGRPDGLDCGYIHRIATDRSGDLWFLSLTRGDVNDDLDSAGAFHLGDSGFEHWGEERGLPPGRAYDMAEGPHGELWFGLSRCLARYRDGVWRTWQAGNGTRWSRAASVAVDGDGRAWFGDEHSGLGCVELDDSVRYWSVADGLVDDSVRQVEIGQDGSVWATTDAGLARFKDGVFSRFGTSAGLPLPRVWPLRLEGSRVLVGTVGAGTAVLDLDADAVDRLPKVDVGAELVSGPAGQALRATWSVVPWWGEMPGDEYLTRVRLDGREWSSWSRERSASLTMPRPGRHVFEVQAAGMAGGVTPPVAVEARVPVHPWKSPFFVVPVALLAILVVTLTVLLLVRHRRHVAALRRSEERYRAIFEDASDAICTLDAQGRILAVNFAGERLLGRSRSSLAGTPLSDLVVQADRPAFASAIEHAGSGAPDAVAEVDVQTPEGRVPVELGARATPGRGVEAVQVIARDVSSRREAEAERLRVERQILEVQRLEGLGLLAGGVAHDFNNLLLAILGHAELAQVDLAVGSAARGSLEVITTAARRAADLTQQLLSYAGKGRHEVQSVDLGALVREMLELLRVSLPKSARVEVDVPSSLPHVQADASRIRQVVMNLVVNAGEALEEEGGVVRVAARDVGDGRVELAVRDSGRGMTEEVRRRIFEPFFTTKFAGRGLGLAAVQGIVRAHGGEIRVESAPGHGTTFTVVLPRAGSRTEGAPERSNGVGDARGGLVLVVDDDDSVRNLAVAALERAGMRVLPASDAESAMTAFEEHRGAVDFALLDVVMPGCRGDELLRRLRDRDPDLRALFMSGYAGHASDDALGAPLLPKPFSVKDLVATVRRLRES